MEPLLEARGITKAFAGVVAVDSLNLTILPGEVLALVGENGAGKSTVIKMISGQYAPDAGELRFQGSRFVSRARRCAECRHRRDPPGAATRPADVRRRERGARPLAERGRGRRFRRARKIAATCCRPSVSTCVDTPSKTLHRPAAARRDRPGARLPVEAPDPRRADGVAEQRRGRAADGTHRRAKNRGLGILYVSHRMEEIFRLADRIAVMRDGKLVGVRPAPNSTTTRSWR